MHIIVLPLGLIVALFNSFTDSLPIAVGSGPATDVNKRFLFGNVGDLTLPTGDIFQTSDNFEDDDVFIASDQNPSSSCTAQKWGIGISAGCVMPPSSSDGQSTSPGLRSQPPSAPPVRPANLQAPRRPAFQQNPTMPLLTLPKSMPPAMVPDGATEELNYQPDYQNSPWNHQ